MKNSFAGDSTSLFYHCLRPGGFSNEFSEDQKKSCGLDGKKAWAGVHHESSEGHKKHNLACLATDEAGAVEEKIP